MYTYAYDRQKALLVARLAAGGDETQDFPRHIERMSVAAAETHADGSVLCILVIFEREHSLPSPSVRKAVAEATSRETFRPHLAIVTGNPLVRGVLTALAWLRKPEFAIKLFASASEACRWLEEKRGKPLPHLAQLLAQVRRDAA